MKNVMRLVICIFTITTPNIWTIYRGNGYVFHEYTNFGKLTDDIVSIFHENSFLTIIDMYYNKAHTPEDKSLIVVAGIQDGDYYRPIILKYNTEGVLQTTVLPAEEVNNIYIELTARVLWEDTRFYLPLYSRDGNQGNAVIQRYTYHLALDTDFAGDGTFPIGGIDNTLYSISCFARAGDKYYAGGRKREVNGVTQYCILQFDVNFAYEGIYEGAVLDDDDFQIISQMAIFTAEDKTFAVITTPVGEGKSVELVDEEIVVKTEPDSEDFPFHAILKDDDTHFFTASNNKLLYWSINEEGVITKSEHEGEIDINLVSGARFADSFHLYSMSESEGGRLLVGGSYTKNGDHRYPIVACFNVADLEDLKLDTTFFQTGVWTYPTTKFTSSFFNMTPLVITKHTPFSLVFGMFNQMVHIYPEFNRKYRELRERLLYEHLRGNVIPLLHYTY